jgi:hypothetical protein
VSSICLAREQRILTLTFLSIVRLYTIKIFASSNDPFYDGAPINIWSFIEVNVAIICASVPGMLLTSLLLSLYHN